MRLSRLDYDKAWRCPGWSGGGFRKPPDTPRCSGSFASFIFERRAWQWRFTRCRDCGAACLPSVTRWLDPAYLHHRLSLARRR